MVEQVLDIDDPLSRAGAPVVQNLKGNELAEIDVVTVTNPMQHGMRISCVLKSEVS